MWIAVNSLLKQFAFCSLTKLNIPKTFSYFEETMNVPQSIEYMDSMMNVCIQLLFGSKYKEKQISLTKMSHTVSEKSFTVDLVSTSNV